MRKIASLLATISVLVVPASASAHAVLYGSPGPEQEQLQQWIDMSHAPTPNIRVRLYEGNCQEGRPEGHRAEVNERPEDYGPGVRPPSSEVQTCAAFTLKGSGTPDATNEAIYIPHMSWHPQYPMWWWHLSLLNELGHTYDLIANDRGLYRERFSRIIGLGYDASSWWPVNGWAALDAEWEKWSMAFALCGYGASFTNAHALIEDGEYSGFGFNPGPEEYAEMCRLIHSLH